MAMAMKITMGLMLVGFGPIACDVERDKGTTELRAAQSADGSFTILAEDEVVDVLGGEIAESVSEQVESLPDDAVAGPACNCVIGTAYLRRVGFECFVASCDFNADCPLPTGSWGPEKSIPCPREVL